VVAVNDLGDVENLAYLLRYDTVYGRAPFEVSVDPAPSVEGAGDAHALVVGGRRVRFLSEREPTKLPWGELGVDVVVESTGVFDSYEKSRAHLTAGAKRVVVTAPMKDAPPEDIGGATVLMGVNDEALKKCVISSNASCTTNAASPVMQILHEKIGIKKAFLNTVHAYTATQAVVDSPVGKDFRRGRAAAQNIIPSSTGAAISVTEAISELKGLFDGIALRVPVVAGSIADITFLAARETSIEEVNGVLCTAAKDARWKKIFSVTDEPIVSSDIVGSTYASIADLSMTRVVAGDLVKVLAWYDNEMGYVHALLEHVVKSGEHAR
jgi:glyceraldehyde 3-phosphate dehydrogenase